MSELTNISADDLVRIEDNYDCLLIKLAQIEAVGQESIPGDVVSRLVAGEPPLLVWRNHRALDQSALAEASGVSVADIDAVERRGADLGLRKMVALARALRLDAEALLPWSDDVSIAAE